MVVDHDHDPSIKRSLSRCIRAVYYQRLLNREYPEAPWIGVARKTSQKSIFFVPLSSKLSLSEQIFMGIQSILQKTTFLLLTIRENMLGK
jgi:hypothetical protein